jgi:hypothetical protein
LKIKTQEQNNRAEDDPDDAICFSDITLHEILLSSYLTLEFSRRQKAQLFDGRLE